MKSKPLNAAQILELLQKVLPKATSDTHLANVICQEMQKELQLMANVQSFEKFCEKGAIPDLEPQTVSELQTELAGKFGEENVVMTPDEKGEAMAVEITLPDRTLSSRVKVDPAIVEEEVKVPLVPFPVSLPEDPGLIWMLGRREDLGPDEAARALEKIQAEFWETKKGQQLQRDRVEKCFAEFIVEVPATALTESGLKRHYKGPEPLRTLRAMPAEVPVES